MPYTRKPSPELAKAQTCFASSSRVSFFLATGSTASRVKSALPAPLRQLARDLDSTSSRQSAGRKGSSRFPRGTHVTQVDQKRPGEESGRELRFMKKSPWSCTSRPVVQEAGA